MSLQRRPPPGNVRRAQSIGGNLRGTITNKANRVVQFESFGERAWLLRLERDRRVTDYASQPETFVWVDRHGATRRYTPDFIVWLRDGATEIHEVTRSERRTVAEADRRAPDGLALAPPQKRVERMLAREEEARRVCAERGWRYLVHTERSLPQGAELANLLALYRYRPSVYACACVAGAARACLAGGLRVPLPTLVARIAREVDLPPHDIIPSVCHLLWHGVLDADLHTLLFINGALTPAARVWLASPQEAQEAW